MSFRYRAYAANGDVLKVGAAPRGEVRFTSKERVESVVLYEGPPQTEAVAGSVKVGKAGEISVKFEQKP